MGGTRGEGMSDEFDQNNEARGSRAHSQSQCWGGEPKATLRLTGL